MFEMIQKRSSTDHEKKILKINFLISVYKNKCWILIINVIFRMFLNLSSNDFKKLNKNVVSKFVWLFKFIWLRLLLNMKFNDKMFIKKRMLIQHFLKQDFLKCRKQNVIDSQSNLIFCENHRSFSKNNHFKK